MNKRAFILLGSLLINITGLFAAEKESRFFMQEALPSFYKKTSAIENLRLNPWELGPEVAKMSSLAQTSQGLQEQDALLWGLSGQFQYNLPAHPWLLRVKGQFLTGRPQNAEDYRPFAYSSEKTHRLQWGASLGPAFRVLNQSLLRPFIGILFTTQWSTLTFESLGPFQQRLSSDHIPLGFSWDFELSNQSTLGLAVEYDYMLSGRATSKLSQTSKSLDNQHRKIADGEAMQASLRYTHAIADKTLSLRLYYQYWDLGQSLDTLHQQIRYHIDNQQTILTGVMTSVAF